jgi:hypothetical protein
VLRPNNELGDFRCAPRHAEAVAPGEMSGLCLTRGNDAGKERSHARVQLQTSVIYFLHMGAKETTLKEIGEMLEHVVKHMASKDDIARLDIRIDKLDAKIDRLDTKLTKFEEREIDKRKQLEVRVATIEKHLSLDKEIAA